MLEVSQIGIIGAIQRSAPAVAEIWLRWTGIYGLETCTFDVENNSNNKNMPMTKIGISIHSPNIDDTRNDLCNVLELKNDDSNRRKQAIMLDDDSPAHGLFWGKLIRKSTYSSTSPLEFWWALAVLRSGGVIRATERLMLELGVTDRASLFAGSVARLNNPTFDIRERTAGRALGKNKYASPKSLDIHPIVDYSHVTKSENVIRIPLEGENLDLISSAVMLLALA